MLSNEQIDCEIENILSMHGASMTYFINGIFRGIDKDVKPLKIRNRLNALKKQGKVMNVESVYKRQLKWALDEKSLLWLPF